MAKQQSFADKAKGKKKESGITVKLIKTVKTEKVLINLMRDLLR